MTTEQIRNYLEFYRDLGFDAVYKRRVPISRQPSVGTSADTAGMCPEGAHRATGGADSQSAAPRLLGTHGATAASEREDTLAKIRADIGDCTRCRLCQGRRNIVFGSGNERSPLVFVGEGPGADEDEQGLPFVGRAGRLLTQMIDNTAAKEGIPVRRSDVYICNVVKCRPPDNRTPLPDEIETCGQFLFRQLMAIKPKAICCLGATAMKALLDSKEGITKRRGKWHKWRDIPVMVTYHPSYLLRQYTQQAKREAWEDLKALLHFVYD
jgi:uracil-DNA glycosylase